MSSLAASASNIAARARPRALSNLLLFVAGLVFAMVVVGGITRLTESGLSITEWRPVTGAIPPLSHSDWVRAFDLYKQTPQYREVAGPAGMTLAGFKFIFFWEWVHRLLGRIIGLIFFVGVGWFAVKREIPKGYGWRPAARRGWNRSPNASRARAARPRPAFESSTRIVRSMS
jgi:cytochrome c oxidase assembly protein subunit 15